METRKVRYSSKFMSIVYQIEMRIFSDLFLIYVNLYRFAQNQKRKIIILLSRGILHSQYCTSTFYRRYDSISTICFQHSRIKAENLKKCLLAFWVPYKCDNCDSSSPPRAIALSSALGFYSKSFPIFYFNPLCNCHIMQYYNRRNGLDQSLLSWLTTHLRFYLKFIGCVLKYHRKTNHFSRIARCKNAKLCSTETILRVDEVG